MMASTAQWASRAGLHILADAAQHVYVGALLRFFHLIGVVVAYAEVIIANVRVVVAYVVGLIAYFCGHYCLFWWHCRLWLDGEKGFIRQSVGGIAHKYGESSRLHRPLVRFLVIKTECVPANGDGDVSGLPRFEENFSETL